MRKWFLIALFALVMGLIVPTDAVAGDWGIWLNFGGCGYYGYSGYYGAYGGPSCYGGYGYSPYYQPYYYGCYPRYVCYPTYGRYPYYGSYPCYGRRTPCYRGTNYYPYYRRGTAYTWYGGGCPVPRYYSPRGTTMGGCNPYGYRSSRGYSGSLCLPGRGGMMMPRSTGGTRYMGR